MKKETKCILGLMAVVLIISFGIYLKTLAPTVSFGDSGDFISAAYVLGICHPPGYPLYLICAKLFSWLPIGTDIAYRINLMSAFFAAVAVSLLYLLIFRIQQWFYPEDYSLHGNKPLAVPNWISHLVAMVGALSFAFSSSFWSQAVVAEVHTMNAVFVISLILTILAYIKFGELRFLYAASFLWGLSFGVHQTGILFLPIILIFLVVKGVGKKIFTPGIFLVLVGLAFFGWAVHLYFPLVAIRYPARNWDNPQYISDFVNLVLRADYNKFRWARSLSLAWDQFSSAGFTLITQYTVFFYWLGIVGLWRMIKKDWKTTGFLFLLALIIWIFFSAVTNFPMEHTLYIDLREAFFIPAYLLYAVWMALGLRWIISLSQYYKFDVKQKLVPIVVYIISITIPVTILLTHYREQDKSHYYFAYDLGQAIIDTMQPNAIYFTDDDPFYFPVLYLAIVEKQRPDTEIISRSTMYKWWFYDQFKYRNPNHLVIPKYEPEKTNLYKVYLDTKTNEFAQLNLTRHHIYFFFTPILKLAPQYQIIQTGILYQIVTALPPEVVGVETVKYRPSRITYRYRGTPEDGLSDDDWTQFAVNLFCNFHIRQGDYHTIKREFQKAVNEYAIAVKIKPDSADAYYHWGTLYELLNDQQRAAQAFENVLKLNADYPKVREKLNRLNAMPPKY